MNGTELAFTLTSLGITALFGTASIDLLLVYAWIRTLEQSEHENEED